MKSRILALFLFVAKNAGISSHAQVDARVWMLDHPDSKPDDLAELKDQNPEAYALVNALLTKRSLGLLDPRHPTASFATATVQDDHIPGAEAFAKLATTPAEKQALQADAQSSHSSAVELPFPDAKPQSHDWLNWKPPSGGMDDESMVRNVLGAVADLTKGKALRGNQQSEDASPFNAAVEAAKQEEQTTALATTAAPVAVASASVVPEAHQNSYLKDYDLVPSPKHQQQLLGENVLTSFTWDDAPKVQATTTTKAVKASKQNSLASWLGFKPHVQTAAPVVEQKLSNPYLADLQ